MPRPNAKKHNPSPEYLRSLIEGAGLSQRKAALVCGIGDRTMRYYLSGGHKCPYAVQFCLENL